MGYIGIIHLVRTQNSMLLKFFKHFNIGKHCGDIHKTSKKCPHLGENKKKIKEPSNNKAILKADQKTDALKMKKHCIKLN